MLVGAPDPVAIGREEISRVAGSKASAVVLRIAPGSKEGFRISGDGGKVQIVGSDPVGAMYGAFEFAERLRNNGASAWSTKVEQKPFLADRGLNLFLTLPWNYVKNDTDYDPAALTDPNRWWFHNEDYWKTLLDLMAHSRLNWLDIHGTWDISVTDAPNLYAYFIQSDKFPQVGVASEVKAANLRQLNHVIDMAHSRGIRVSLMAYQADLRIPQNRTPPYKNDEPTIYDYTRDVVERMIRQAPGLDAIGFRIGESGKSESFFKCYGEAVKRSGRDIPLITRSWITRRQNVLPLARASKDFTVEIKYNGEQWGAPYPVAGGRMPNWYSYSFEDYLSDAGDPKLNAKTWPGQPTEDGKRWPSEPYKVVWQVRANGTHRIFPFYNPEWVRRSIKAMRMGTASGYTIEGLDAYYPKSPDYYLADPKDKYCNWIHQRDEMYWMTWGRLGYDPTVPEATFDAQADRLLGKGSHPLVQAWKEASLLMPKAFMAYSLGPDHRNHAPELEWGGDTSAYVQGQGLDSFSFLPINEELANRATGGVDGRIPLLDVARDQGIPETLLGRTASFFQSPSLRAREIAETVVMDSTLASYYQGRFTAASEYAQTEAAQGPPGATDLMRSSMRDAAEAMRLLGTNTRYKPFTERLRMRTNTFSWSGEAKKVADEVARLHGLPGAINPVPSIVSGAGRKRDEAMSWFDTGKTITCALRAPFADRAWLLVKPLPSSTFFHRIPMRRHGTQFEAEFDRDRCGHMVAAELLYGRKAVRYPGPFPVAPYLVIPARSGPTPQIYNATEAASHLKPSVIDSSKYGGLLLGTRAWAFFSSFDRATKRKLLDPVERGMRLVILQQDFNRYKLDWLPKPLKIEPANNSVFDPGGQLGLGKVETAGIMWQRFAPSEGWEIFGNGGLARMKLGKGEIWVTSARLMQTMHLPASAKAFVRLLSLGGKTKPTILVDSCSEGAEFTSSCHPDLMNSHDIPFMTLGEVIAKEQGMDSFTTIPGPVADDDLLGGKGAEIANKFLRDRVVSLSKRPTPASAADFEPERARRRKELLRTLGLDPMPAKTPLNARITGRIQRNGYHIEKLVFESRPKFYVTAHVYVPDRPAEAKMPVIVNVNGHWAHKKGEDRLQYRSAFQALHGYMAVTIDSPGWSFEGDSLIERRPEGDHNDFKLVEGGTNTTGYYVWDAIRALDYVETRPDADMSRIGLTGASGGGLATLYLFAADDRYKAAVPVVYMSSMELAPDNGCLCNHVPGTSLIGDRSDVIGIQAPKPVLLMGAQNDGEFPPDAMRLTHKKMGETWRLFGKQDDVYVKIFPGGHDYSKPMRETMMGFFDRYLLKKGDGSPVPEPPIELLNPEDRSILVLDPPIAGERTMRDLSKEYLAAAPAAASVAEVFRVNGGVPARTDMKYHEIGDGPKRTVTFESEPGLATPGVLVLPSGKPSGVRIVVADDGKSPEVRPSTDGFATLYLDTLGTGELAGFDMRYAVYAGRSVAFTGGWQIARAAEAMRKYSNHIEVVGKGPLSSQAAMYAGLMDPTFAKVTGIDCLRTWADVFADGIPDYAVQPRAHLCGLLESLRAKVKNGDWRLR
ncbi:acetylxylan esterase [Fimbriimonas ginsengisoli]|uniref:Gluconolactonase n=1 Tax=Fimbriimonas ginsengisoli Gsoil 348 TaxID=661478 RepID=A0A068NSC2_FIMGI|nr:acetylxylan esterase [Fimbriimonas ginsengisoli]AIE86247.1 gluconolactonase [Fimbriimonas ginsengisoli Gsoil 348]